MVDYKEHTKLFQNINPEHAHIHESCSKTLKCLALGSLGLSSMLFAHAHICIISDISLLQTARHTRMRACYKICPHTETLFIILQQLFQQKKITVINRIRCQA